MAVLLCSLLGIVVVHRKDAFKLLLLKFEIHWSCCKNDRNMCQLSPIN